MSSLKKEIFKGVFWVGIAKYFGLVINLIITAILARLISPTAFGAIAVAMVLLYFMQIFSDIGFGTAIVQFKDITKRQLSSIFTITFYNGIILGSLLFFFSTGIAKYYQNDSLIIICKVLSVVMFLFSLNVVPNSLMRRDHNFKILSLCTLSFLIISGSIAIWGAYNGWGVYALLVSPLVTSLGMFIVNFYHYPLKLVLKLDSNIFHRIFSYSSYQFAFTFMNYFSRNLDKLIIGKYLSLEKLGYYDKSYHLMLLPLQNITFVIEPVLHPILSSLQDKKIELYEKNKKLSQIISCISFPIGVALYFSGGEIIRIIYGENWNDAIPVFRILALSLPFQMILSTSGAIYQSAGKTNFLFYNGLTQL